MALDLKPLEIEPLFRCEMFPDITLNTIWHQIITCNLDGVIDHRFEWVFLVLLPHTKKLPLDIDVFNLSVLCDDPEGGCVGCKLVIGVAEIRVFLVVEGEHTVELILNLDLDLRVYLVEENGIVRGLFTEDEKHGTLDIVACF